MGPRTNPTVRGILYSLVHITKAYEGLDLDPPDPEAQDSCTGQLPWLWLFGW